MFSPLTDALPSFSSQTSKLGVWEELQVTQEDPLSFLQDSIVVTAKKMTTKYDFLYIFNHF